MVDLEWFKELLLTVDPNIKKYSGPGTGEYTTWQPGGVEDALMADDHEEDVVQRVYIDRYTKQDNDPIAKRIYKLLDDHEIPFIHDMDYEDETKYIHHIFTCYVSG